MFIVALILAHFAILHSALVQLPPIPLTLQDLIPYLVMPAVLGYLANVAVNVFAAGSSDQTKLFVKFLAYIAIGLADLGLHYIPPDVAANLATPLAVLLGVIAAFVGAVVTSGIHGLWIAGRLIGFRILMGRDAFLSQFKSEGMTLLPKPVQIASYRIKRAHG